MEVRHGGDGDGVKVVVGQVEGREGGEAIGGFEG